MFESYLLSFINLYISKYYLIIFYLLNKLLNYSNISDFYYYCIFGFLFIIICLNYIFFDTTSKKNNNLINKIKNSKMSNQSKKYFLSICNFLNDNNDPSERLSTEKWINEWLSIPHQIYSDDIIKNTDTKKIVKSLQQFQEKLDKIIYGQEKAKEQFLLFKAKQLTKPNSLGSAIAIEGPPGIGKTSLIEKGISVAMGRPFIFISLGGISDGSYLEGHNRAYVNSSYGQITKALIESKSMDPIIYFDELDKVSKTSKGDEIMNILIHITDISQNSHYVDKYFKQPLDLSKILFVFSYNNPHYVDPILLNRLSVIKMSGYNKKEKINIIENYILPDMISNFGILPNDIRINSEGLEYIINNVELEPGMRSVKKKIEFLVSKINLLRLNKNLKLKINSEIKYIKLPIILSKEFIKIIDVRKNEM